MERDVRPFSQQGSVARVFQGLKDNLCQSLESFLKLFFFFCYVSFSPKRNEKEQKNLLVSYFIPSVFHHSIFSFL